MPTARKRGAGVMKMSAAAGDEKLDELRDIILA